MRKAVPLLAVICLAPMVSGCVYVMAAGAVTAVSVARQERTVGNAVDDVRITTELSSKLTDQSAANLVNVSSTVVEGRVLLTGRVTSPEARLEATRVAWSIEGVRKVDNDIQVTEDGQWLDRPMDIFIRTKLTAELLADFDIRDVNYTIDVVNGVVYLTGIGQDQQEIDRVVAYAKDIPQVTRVENYVVLKTDPIRYGLVSASQVQTAAPEAAPASAPRESEPITVEPMPAPGEAGSGEPAGTEATGAPAPLTPGT